MNSARLLFLAVLVQAQPRAALIRFERFSDDALEARVAELEARACPLRLEVDGVHAIDAQTALVYGDIDEAWAFRSVLLRSADGGDSWKEVMKPVTGSTVLGLSFPSEARGFAFVEWIVEGPGDLLFYRTGDAGSTWDLVSEIPRPHNLDEAIFVGCSSPLRCKVTLRCVHGGGHIVETLDGGRTWRVSRASRSISSQASVSQDRAGDGTAWRLENSSDSPIRVSRRLRGSDWTTVALMHTEYRLVDGQLLPCGQGN